MPFCRKASYLPIGLEIGFDAVRLVQLQCGGRGVRVEALAAEPLRVAAGSDVETRRAAAAAAVGRLLKCSTFSGRRVAVALPRELVHFRTLRLPPMPDEEIAWAVQADARDVFLFDTAKARIEFLDAGEVRQGGDPRREIIMMAAGAELVDQFIEQFHRAGATFDSIDVEPLAIYRAAAGAAGVSAVLEVGPARSHLVIGQGSQIRLIRVIEVGGLQFAEAIGRKLGMTTDEAWQMRRRLGNGETTGGARDSVRRAVADATRGLITMLAREVAACLRYHAVVFRGAGPAGLRLVGAEAGDSHLGAALQSALSITVQRVSLWRSFEIAPNAAGLAVGESGEWSAALGLALRRVAPSALAALRASGADRSAPAGESAPPAALAEAIHA